MHRELRGGKKKWLVPAKCTRGQAATLFLLLFLLSSLFFRLATFVAIERHGPSSSLPASVLSPLQRGTTKKNSNNGEMAAAPFPIQQPSRQHFPMYELRGGIRLPSRSALLALSVTSKVPARFERSYFILDTSQAQSCSLSDAPHLPSNATHPCGMQDPVLEHYVVAAIRIQQGKPIKAFLFFVNTLPSPQEDPFFSVQRLVNLGAQSEADYSCAEARPREAGRDRADAGGEGGRGGEGERPEAGEGNGEEAVSLCSIDVLSTTSYIQSMQLVLPLHSSLYSMQPRSFAGRVRHRLSNKTGEHQLQLPSLLRVLVLGLGGALLPSFLRAVFPFAHLLHLEVVENDLTTIHFAEKYFDFPSSSSSSSSNKNFRLPGNVIQADAVAFLQSRLLRQQLGGKEKEEEELDLYDIIFLDVFNVDWMPTSLSTPAFVSLVHQNLNSNGIAALNVIKNDPNAPLVSQLFFSVFPSLHTFIPTIDSGNRILVFTKQPAPDKEKAWSLQEQREALQRATVRFWKHEVLPQLTTCSQEEGQQEDEDDKRRRSNNPLASLFSSWFSPTTTTKDQLQDCQKVPVSSHLQEQTERIALRHDVLITTEYQGVSSSSPHPVGD